MCVCVCVCACVYVCTRVCEHCVCAVLLVSLSRSPLAAAASVRRATGADAVEPSGLDAMYRVRITPGMVRALSMPQGTFVCVCVGCGVVCACF